MDASSIRTPGKQNSLVNGRLSPLQHPSQKHPNSMSLRSGAKKSQLSLMAPPNMRGGGQSRPIDD